MYKNTYNYNRGKENSDVLNSVSARVRLTD